MGEPYSTRVWDLPTRMFHWSLVLLILVLWISGEFGGLDITVTLPVLGERYYSNMDIHALAGQGVLVLVLFRIFWGLWGSRTSRFTHFLHAPAVVWRKARELMAGKLSHSVGHNPLGGVMVLLLLIVLLMQSVSGLFSADDLFFQGPLSHLVQASAVEALTALHHWSFSGLQILIVLHLAAIGFYYFKGHNLVLPMFTGKRRLSAQQGLYFAPAWKSWLCFLLALGVVLVLRSF